MECSPIFVVQLLLAAPVPKAVEAPVTVRPLATAIEVDDPLDISICFVNKSKQPVVLKGFWELDPAVNNVWVEVKGPSDREFWRVHAPLQGRGRVICVVGKGEEDQRPPSVQPDERRCVIVPMHNWNRPENDLFTIMGKWQVRGVVLLKDEELTSEAVEIEVRGRSKASAAAMKELGRRVLWPNAVTVGEPLEAEEMKLLDEHYPALKGSYTGKLIERARVLNPLCRAEYKDFSVTVVEALKPVDEHLAKLSGIEYDYFNYLVAMAFFRKGIGKSNVEMARKYYDRVKYMPTNGRELKFRFDPFTKPDKK